MGREFITLGTSDTQPSGQKQLRMILRKCRGVDKPVYTLLVELLLKVLSVLIADIKIYPVSAQFSGYRALGPVRSRNMNTRIERHKRKRAQARSRYSGYINIHLNAPYIYSA